jgi:hypothetical protein
MIDKHYEKHQISLLNACVLKLARNTRSQHSAERGQLFEAAFDNVFAYGKRSVPKKTSALVGYI